MPQQFDVVLSIKFADRIRILFGSKLYIQTFVAMPFRGEEPMVKSGVGFDKFFYKIGQAIKSSLKSLTPAPDIKPLRGQRNTQ